MDQYTPLIIDTLMYLAYFVIMVLGVISHFFKKKIKGETVADIKAYFHSHFKETVVTLIAAVIGFASLIATDGMSVIAAFTVGFAAESLFNKAK